MISLSLLVAALAGLFVALIYRTFFNKVSKEELYQREMEAILEDDETGYYKRDSEKKKDGFLSRWNKLWNDYLTIRFPERYSDSETKAGRDVLISMFGALIVVYFLTRNLLMSIAIVAALTYIVHFIFKIEKKNRSSKIGDQITGFLQTLKSNVQAGNQPDNALRIIIDGIENPLRDELMPIKSHLESGTPFKESLKYLRSVTTSEEVKSLCSYLIQSSLSGGSVESQIDTVIETVRRKKEVSDKIKEETRSSESQKNIAALIIPIMFIVIYLIDETARSFWFINPYSWPIIGAIVLLCAVAFYHAKKSVDSVKKLAQ